MRTNQEEEIRAIVRKELKEIVVRMLAYLSMPKPEEGTEPEQVQLELFSKPEKEAAKKKFKRITFRNGFSIKYVGKSERFYHSEREFVEEITNQHLPLGYKCNGNKNKAKTHEEAIHKYRVHLEKLLKTAGSILIIEKVKRTTTAGEVFEA